MSSEPFQFTPPREPPQPPRNVTAWLVAIGLVVIVVVASATIGSDIMRVLVGILRIFTLFHGR